MSCSSKYPAPNNYRVPNALGLELILPGNQLMYWISLPHCLVSFSLPEGNNAFPNSLIARMFSVLYSPVYRSKRTVLLCIG